MAMPMVVTMMRLMLRRGEIAVGVVHGDLVAAFPVHDTRLVGALLVDRVGFAVGAAAVQAR